MTTVLRTILIHQAALEQLTRKAALVGSTQQIRRLRVASRHLAAELSTNMDLMLRLSILEGAAGVSAGEWQHKSPAAGLAMARQALGPAVAAEWFSATSTGMYTLLESVLTKILVSSGVTEESAYDIILRALVGLGSTNTATQKLFYETGEVHKDKIKQGSERPITLARGPLRNLLIKRALDRAVRSQRRHDLTGRPTPEGVVQDPNDQRAQESGNASVLFRVDRIDLLVDLFRFEESPLGNKVRALFRSTWQRKPYAWVMDYWFKRLLQGDKLSGSEVRAYWLAHKDEHGGIPATFYEQDLSHRWIGGAIQAFQAALTKDPKLQDEIELFLHHRNRTASRERASRRDSSLLLLEPF